jgi:hypothetical protein
VIGAVIGIFISYGDEPGEYGGLLIGNGADGGDGGAGSTGNTANGNAGTDGESGAVAVN